MRLIAFADEVGSTDSDEEAYNRQGISRDETGLHAYRTSVASRRVTTFSNILKHLLQPKRTMVLKNVGDELVIVRRCMSPEDVLECVDALHKAWLGAVNDKGERTVRVGCHVTRVDEVATGDVLKNFREELRMALECESDALGDLWPSLSLITDDIFGAPMNRAARLKAFSHGAEFVLSDEISVAIAGQKQLLRLNPDRSSSAWKEAADEGIRRLLGRLPNTKASPVPLVRLKGVSPIDIRHSWIAYDIHPASLALSTLATRAKCVHSIRLVEAWGIPAFTEDELSELPNELERRLELSKLSGATEGERSDARSIKFFIDAAFMIMNSRRGHQPSFNREHSILSAYDTSDTSRRRRPVFLILTSISDHDSDEKLRQELASIKSRKIRLKPMSFPVFGVPVCLKSPTDQPYPRSSDYLFIDFQVRSIAQEVDPDNREAVFAGIEQECNNLGLTLVCYQMTEGLVDGSLIASVNPGYDLDTFCKRLIDCEPVDSIPADLNFFSRIAPINVHRMRLLSAFGGQHTVWSERELAQ